MIEKLDLSTFKLVSNFLLVLPDPDFNIVAITGPEGTKVELKIISTGEQEANHYSISGTIIKHPESYYYFDKNSEQSGGMSQISFASAMKKSMSIKSDNPYQEGDRIYYNYNVQLSCEEENRLIDTEEHGICMLVPVDFVFAIERDEELIPVNGYVFFERDKEDSEYQTESGLTIIRNVKGYEQNTATVISSSSPVMSYLDGGVITGESYEKGDRIIIDRRFGYKMAYDLHAKELKNVECVLQKHILMKFEEVES